MASLANTTELTMLSSVQGSTVNMRTLSPHTRFDVPGLQLKPPTSVTLFVCRLLFTRYIVRIQRALVVSIAPLTSRERYSLSTYASIPRATRVYDAIIRPLLTAQHLTDIFGDLSTHLTLPHDATLLTISFPTRDCGKRSVSNDARSLLLGRI